MPIQIIREDITKWKCDAIVNAANETLLGGGGVDGAIHRAAGPQLLEECRLLGGCATGKAKITGAYNLPAKYVIHTVGPIWRGGDHGEKMLLESCYYESLSLAEEYGCESVAFPLISSGVYGYPKDQAFKVAIDVISTFLLEHELMVYVVIFDKLAYQISEKLFANIQSYIDDHYVELHEDRYFENRRMQQFGESQAMREAAPVPCASVKDAVIPDAASAPSAPAKDAVIPDAASAPMMPDEVCSTMAMSLDDCLEQIDESFSQMLLRKIDEAGMTDAQCYKKANVDRKLFSKIRTNIHYNPKKTTALAFAIALELDLKETKDLLMKAGYALSHSNKFDIIVEYFIQNKIYDIYEINEALFAFDQSLLGSG